MLAAQRRIPVSVRAVQRSIEPQLKSATIETGTPSHFPTTLRKRLAVGGGTAAGKRRNQREAATPLTAPMLASALAIATSSVAAVAATPVETLRSLHLCRSRDSATHRCGARNHGQVTAAAISSMCPQQLGTPTLHTGSLSPLEHRWNQLCARTSHPNFNGLNPARAC